MAHDNLTTIDEPRLWVVNANEKEQVDARDLTAYWEKAPGGSVLMIGNEVVAVKK